MIVYQPMAQWRLSVPVAPCVAMRRLASSTLLLDAFFFFVPERDWENLESSCLAPDDEMECVYVCVVLFAAPTREPIA